VVSNSKSTTSLVILGLVDLSPVVGSSNDSDNSSLSDSIGTSELHPDSSEVLLLGEEGSVVSNSVSELDLELLDLLLGSLLSSIGGSLSEFVYPEFVGGSDLDHLLLGSDHEDVHLLGSDVGTMSLDSPSLGILNKGSLPLNGSSSLSECDLAEVDRNLVGLDSSSLEQDSTLSSLGSEVLSGNLLSPVPDHSVSVGFRLLHVGVSNSHSSSSLSGLSSVVDHEGMSLSSSDLGVFSLSEGLVLESESDHVLAMSNLSKSLSSNSESSGIDGLDSPSVDDSLVVSNRSLSVHLSSEFQLEGLVGSVSSNQKLGERELVSLLGFESSLVHSLGSVFTTNSLSVVVVSNSFSMNSSLGALSESLLSIKLDLESSSHDSSSSS